ncbi:MAG: VIT1/CCC1 transporter family protein [Acidimicrobiales bacterium]
MTETGSSGAGASMSAEERLHAVMRTDEVEHRDVRGGAARAAVFGISDGLVSNVGLILGVAGAAVSPGVVRVAGIAGLVAGAVSMAAGEYNSMQVQADLLRRELAVERRHLAADPEAETLLLTHIYEAKGMDAATARQASRQLMADPDRALEAHAREELGIDPAELGSPIGAAAWSLGCFAVGAFVPLVPWFVTRGAAAIVASLTLALLAAVAVGTAVARFAERPVWLAAGRQVVFTLVPAVITYAIGSVIGVTVG